MILYQPRKTKGLILIGYFKGLGNNGCVINFELKPPTIVDAAWKGIILFDDINQPEVSTHLEDHDLLCGVKYDGANCTHTWDKRIAIYNIEISRIRF